jgi:hypothetical protein
VDWGRIFLPKRRRQQSLLYRVSTRNNSITRNKESPWKRTVSKRTLVFLLFFCEIHDLPPAEQNGPSLPPRVISYSLSCSSCLSLIFILELSRFYNCLQRALSPCSLLTFPNRKLLSLPRACIPFGLSFCHPEHKDLLLLSKETDKNLNCVFFIFFFFFGRGKGVLQESMDLRSCTINYLTSNYPFN